MNSLHTLLIPSGIIFDEDFEKLRKDFFKHFSVIEAAGGIVQNENEDLLFIFRRGKWDLPKGKMEKEETAAVCAGREIEEETGAINLVLQDTICDTYHIYDEFGKHFLKVSHWFYFTCSDGQNLRPQTEEDITEIKWFKKRNIKTPMQNTYPAIRDVFDVFFEMP